MAETVFASPVQGLPFIFIHARLNLCKNVLALADGTNHEVAINILLNYHHAATCQLRSAFKAHKTIEYLSIYMMQLNFDIRRELVATSEAPSPILQYRPRILISYNTLHLFSCLL